MGIPEGCSFLCWKRLGGLGGLGVGIEAVGPPPGPQRPFLTINKPWGTGQVFQVLPRWSAASSVPEALHCQPCALVPLLPLLLS